MKRIPLIKFPQRHPKPSAGKTAKIEDVSVNEDIVRRVFQRAPTNASMGGKASDQPKRTPVTQDEIDAVLVHSASRTIGVALMQNMFNVKLPWGSVSNGQEKVVLSAVELESFRSEISSLEERESQYKAQLEHIDGILRSARLSGYLFVRMRWAAFPGDPDPIDDTEVDDWLQRFVVLQGTCIYLYKNATDLSPQDSTLLSDVVEVGYHLSPEREDEETRYCFFILTRHGMRYECSSTSQMQVDSWLVALEDDCKLALDSENLDDPAKSIPDCYTITNKLAQK